jgi:preprotein translocase SecE subunit
MEGSAMAVAVKNSPTTRAPSIFDRLAVASLAGVVYVLGALAIVFKGIPALWDQLAIPGGNFLGVALQGVAMLVVFLLLAVLGARLMGHPPKPGLKAGIFMGLVLLFLVLILSRWLGGIVEGWAYTNHWFAGQEQTFGLVVSGVIVVVFLGLFGRLLFRRWFEKWLVRFEEQGWFSAKVFKPGQGLRVRRGTLLGILLLAVSGIWLLHTHNTLGRGPADWQLSIPFTGKMVVEDLGDAAPLLENNPPATFRVVDAGSLKDLWAGENLSLAKAQQEIGPLVEKKRESLAYLAGPGSKKAEGRKLVPLAERAKELEKVNPAAAGRVRLWREHLWQEVQPELTLTQGQGENQHPNLDVFLLQRDLERWLKAEEERLREGPLSRETGAERLRETLKDMETWAAEEELPVIAPVLDRFQARDDNARLDPLVYRVVRKPIADEQDLSRIPKELQFKPGDIVRDQDLRAAIVALKEQVKKRTGDPAEAARQQQKVEEDALAAAPPAKPMEGKLAYAGITILPAVQYTVPLLLLFLTLWLSWRVVNLPTFGDFLIATEAELNKVSWTTRARLWQDTVVVLTTMVLLAGFLFVVDVAWARLLSSWPIEVLKVSKKEQPKEQELKW